MKPFRCVALWALCCSAAMLFWIPARAWNPIPVSEDPLVRMPGTQPGQVVLEGPGRCLNCHADYNPSIEPGHNWQGSMMAQSARDFLFWACMTVAAQDSIWATGTPNAVDLCERCHFPQGWLEGRSDPPNASAMTGSDYDGVHCDFCHKLWDPFFQEAHAGLRESPDWTGYWDEGNSSDTPSQEAAEMTRQSDATAATDIFNFNGSAFFGADGNPVAPEYTENASGQFFVSGESGKRGPFADASARHQMYYSRYHKSRYFCATCHDVSNPVLGNLGQSGEAPLTTETKSAHAYVHVERTFSEFMLSAYGAEGGSTGLGPFSPEVFYTGNPGNTIAKCQDCHMRDYSGVGCDKRGVPIRPEESLEHPKSGQPLHDLTGGNAWVLYVLASAVPGSSVYDATNAALLNQGPQVLTLDLGAGLGLDPEALLHGVNRSLQQLQLAASITNVLYDPASGQLSLRIQNQTGHKLITGFPEGRRMFLNIRVYAGGQLVQEINPYDAEVGTLKGLPHAQSSPPLGPNELYRDDLVYEVHPSSSLTGEQETFHFALADGRYKDNRIPPKGFRAHEAMARICLPVQEGVDAPGLYSLEEYAGGYDAVSIGLVPNADSIELRLCYQTTSREYIEFLRDEILGTASSLPSPGAGGDPAYLIQTDPFFAQLRAWGDTIWQLWEHNKDIATAAPYVMTEASWGDLPSGCEAPAPALLSAVPGNQNIVLTWTDAHSDDPNVTGYKLYYDQAGKSQLVAELSQVTSFTDTGLTKEQTYCYKVTSTYEGCESLESNVLCAAPHGEPNASIGVPTLDVGRLVRTGKGKTATETFEYTTSFSAGENVVVIAYVYDAAGDPVAGANVTLDVTGPESAQIQSASSGDSGAAEAVWPTSSPNRKGSGGTTPGSYTISVSGVDAAGYNWNAYTAAVVVTVN